MLLKYIINILRNPIFAIISIALTIIGIIFFKKSLLQSIDKSKNEFWFCLKRQFIKLILTLFCTFPLTYQVYSWLNYQTWIKDPWHLYWIGLGFIGYSICVWWKNINLSLKNENEYIEKNKTESQKNISDFLRSYLFQYVILFIVSFCILELCILEIPIFHNLLKPTEYLMAFIIGWSADILWDEGKPHKIITKIKEIFK
jgi:hypothetical protein